MNHPFTTLRDQIGLYLIHRNDAVFEVTRVEARDFGRVTEEEFRRLSEKQDKAFEIIESELPALRERLIVKMRRTVGVASHEF